jgi:hypothetical protein
MDNKEFLEKFDAVATKFIQALCVAIEQIKIISPDITIPEIKLPDIHVPDIPAPIVPPIVIPEIVIPPIVVDAPVVHVNIPDVIVPDIVIPEINVPQTNVTVLPTPVNIPAQIRESALPPYDSGKVKYTHTPVGEVWTLSKGKKKVAIVTITYLNDEREELTSFTIETL